MAEMTPERLDQIQARLVALGDTFVDVDDRTICTVTDVGDMPDLVVALRNAWKENDELRRGCLTMTNMPRLTFMGLTWQELEKRIDFYDEHNPHA